MIQPELIHIILRFRTHQYVLTADIAMMYRQINIHDSDKDLQRMCWRKDLNEEIKIFTLNTVTYGTSSAPFLATRCLTQLADDKGENYPLAKIALKNNFYIDDLLTGSSTREQTLRLRHELMELLEKEKLPLRKWRPNHVRRSTRKQIRFSHGVKQRRTYQNVRSAMEFTRRHNSI